MAFDALGRARRARRDERDLLTAAQCLLRPSAGALLDEYQTVARLNAARFEIQRRQKPATGGVQIASEKINHRQTVRRRRRLRVDRRQRGERDDRVVKLLQLELTQAEVLVDGSHVRAVAERAAVRRDGVGVPPSFVE